MTKPPKAIMIFAAGFGTRMGAMTKDRPKPLIPVAGVPMIDRALKLARAVAPSRIVVNLHYHADQMAEHLASRGVILSHEPEILETGGGLRNALPLLQGDVVFTQNPDVIWAGPNPLEMLRDAWKPAQMDALLICIPVARALGHSGNGDFCAQPDGRITRGTELIYGGVQILKTEGLKDIEPNAFSLNLLWDRMQDKSRLFGLTYPGRWCDVGHPEGLVLAESLLEGE